MLSVVGRGVCALCRRTTSVALTGCTPSHVANTAASRLDVSSRKDDGAAQAQCRRRDRAVDVQVSRERPFPPSPLRACAVARAPLPVTGWCSHVLAIAHHSYIPKLSKSRGRRVKATTMTNHVSGVLAPVRVRVLCYYCTRRHVR